MAFRRVSDPVKFYDFSTLPASTVVVENGVYIGAKKSIQFDNNTHFFREQAGSKVGLSGGQLDWLVDEGELVVGQRYRVTFGGKKQLETGKYKGKEANTFIVDLDEDSINAPAPKEAVELAKAPVDEVADVSL